MRAAVFIFSALVMVSCSSYRPPADVGLATPQAPAAAPVNIFDTGTWEKSLGATTCGDFLTKMTASEQFMVGRVLLGTSRMTTLPSAPAPVDAMARKFQQGIANECNLAETGTEYPIIAAGVLVYMADKGYEPAYR